jgi:hypothetical protein
MPASKTVRDRKMFNDICKGMLAAGVLCAASGALAASDETMKGAQFSEFGPSSVLHVVDLPIPHAATGEVLVHRACEERPMNDPASRLPAWMSNTMRISFHA